MRIVVQRVSHASVTIEGQCKSSIGKGMLILVGIEESDGQEDIDWLCKKIVNLRIFDDENGVMNKSILEDGGEILVISQFTLHASTKKGNRPSYIKAAKPDISIPLYEQFCKDLSGALGKEIGTGIFGADMKVELLNDGPVTICMDTKNKEQIFHTNHQSLITKKMTLEEAQKQVDQWVKTYGVRYFSELTNMAVLTEEVGELARVMARKYGDQSFKEGEKDNIDEEIADVLWVLLCIANQTGVDITDAFRKSMEKKTKRDNKRHINNPKLKDHGRE